MGLLLLLVKRVWTVKLLLVRLLTGHLLLLLEKENGELLNSYLSPFLSVFRERPLVQNVGILNRIVATSLFMMTC